MNSAPLHQATFEGPSGERREWAYAQLGQIAELLLRIDPHSPAPYLVKRAVAWGNLGTAQLYQELFVRGEGKLNIFELMGIQVDK